MGGQTSYSLDRPVAVAGQINDTDDLVVRSWPCGTLPILPGTFCELVLLSGNYVVQPAASTGQEIAKPAGVAIYKDMLEPGGYVTGNLVPIMRKGQVWAIYSGSVVPTDLQDAKVSHVSNSATNNGTFTDAASSATVGSEVTGALAKFSGSNSTSTLVLVELDIPRSAP